MLAFVINFQLWPLSTLSLPWAPNVDMMLNREAVTFAASRKGQGSGTPGPDADGRYANTRSCLLHLSFYGRKRHCCSVDHYVLDFSYLYLDTFLTDSIHPAET